MSSLIFFFNEYQMTLLMRMSLIFMIFRIHPPFALGEFIIVIKFNPLSKILLPSLRLTLLSVGSLDFPSSWTLALPPSSATPFSPFF